MDNDEYHAALTDADKALTEAIDFLDEASASAADYDNPWGHADKINGFIVDLNNMIDWIRNQ